MKILKDTITVNGKYSQKRIMTFTSFWVATIYAFSPIIIHIITETFNLKPFIFEVQEFVFIGFIGAGGWSLLRTQKKNENNNYTHDTENLG
jgi:hypothetical protein